MKNGYLSKAFDIVVAIIFSGVTVYIAMNTRVTIVEQKVMAQEQQDRELTEWLERVEGKLDDYIFELTK